MKLIVSTLKSIIICFLFANAVAAQSLFVATYNIRYQNEGDSKKGNGWERRCKVICDQLEFEQPDIFGTQECLAPQAHDMKAALDGYAYIGVGRDDAKEKGEFTAIFYKEKRLKLLKDGNFWLSETPDRPSKGWDAALPRICTWGLFKDKESRKRFYFFNLHLDHVGVVARREAAHLVVRRIKEMAQGLPVILTGDFNVDQNDEIYRIFTESGVLKDCFTCAGKRFAETGTFNSFNVSRWTENRIDHIFVSLPLCVTHYGILTDCYWTNDSTDASSPQAPTRRTPSDHYPVFARIAWR